MDNSGNSNSVNENKDNIDTSSAVGGAPISHSPLNLGGGAAVEMSQRKERKPSVPAAATQLIQQAQTAGRITAVKTFFTKLHGGAIAFLDEQITNWLRDNPDVVVKRTNVIMGEIQGKKTEPNIIIIVWY
jgi:hypothetical protein